MYGPATRRTTGFGTRGKRGCNDAIEDAHGNRRTFGWVGYRRVESGRRPRIIARDALSALRKPRVRTPRLERLQREALPHFEHVQPIAEHACERVSVARPADCRPPPSTESAPVDRNHDRRTATPTPRGWRRSTGRWPFTFSKAMSGWKSTHIRKSREIIGVAAVENRRGRSLDHVAEGAAVGRGVPGPARARVVRDNRGDAHAPALEHVPGLHRRVRFVAHRRGTSRHGAGHRITASVGKRAQRLRAQVVGVRV